MPFSGLPPPSPAQSSDTAGYDEYVEGVEPEETASLETHIAEVGGAYACVFWPGRRIPSPNPPPLEQRGLQTGREDGLEDWSRARQEWARSRLLLLYLSVSHTLLQAVVHSSRVAGRREPIPFNLKDDNMGLGRWSYEVLLNAGSPDISR